MRIILISFLFVAFSAQVYGQAIDRNLICGKKWYYEKMQADNAKPVYVSPAEKNDYFVYKCNGFFESVERGKTTKGVWSYNPKDSSIKVVQPPAPPNNKEVTVATKLVQIDATHLVLQGKANGGGTVTLYLISR